MKKKILSWLLSASMLLSGAATMVSAAGNAVEYGSFTGHRWYSGEGVYVATTEYAHSGNASLKLIGSKGSVSSQILQSVPYEAGASYTVGLYAKISNNWNWMVAAYLGGQQGPTQHMNESGWTKGDVDANGWRYFEAVYNPTKDGNFHIYTNVQNNDLVAYIDDIVVYKTDDPTKTNLLGNGGFEEYTAFRTDVVASMGEDSVTVKWTNPNITSTAVSATINGEAIDVSSANLAAGAVNSVVVENLEPGDYEVVVTTTNAFGKVSGSAKATIEEIVPLEFGTVTTGWGYQHNLPWYPVTTEKSYSGKASLKVDGVRRVGDTFQTQVMQTVNYESGAEYEISFYLNINDFGWKWMLTALLGTNPGGLGNCNESGYTWTETDKPGWYKGTAKYKPSGDNVFHIANNNGANDPRFWAYIDDVSVVKVGGDGTNLIVNGGFEEYAPTNVKITETKAENGQVVVTWTNPVLPSNEITITANGEVVDTSDVNLTKATSNTKVITGLTNGTSYEIVITAKTAYGDYSATTTATPRDLQVGYASSWWQNSTYLVTTEDSHSGQAALKFTGSATGELLQPVAYDPSKQYKVSLWYKSMPDLGHRWLGKAWLGSEGKIGANGVQHMNDTGWTRPASADELDENGWGYYEATYYPGAPSGSEEYFHIKLNSANGNFVGYFDDIVVTEVGGDGTNLLKNGDFESFTPAKLEITDFAFDDSQFTVSWKNPVIESSAISVTVDGVQQDVSAVNLAANAENTMTIAGLENGVAYDVVITASTAYGEKSDSFVAKPRRITYGVPAEGWGINAYYSITTEDSYSGVAALKFSGAKNDTELLQGFDYDPEKQYNVTLYAKFEPNQAHNWMAKAWLGSEAASGANGVSHLNEHGWTITGPDANGWYKYESSYKPGADATEYFHIKSQATVANFVALIDNITVTEVGGDGTNLLVNGDFESYKKFPNVITDPYLYDNETLIWTVTGNADYFKVYKKSGDELVYLGQTDDGKSDYFVLDEYAVDGDTFVITSVVAGTETEGYEVFAGFDAKAVFGFGTIAEDGSVTLTEELSEIAEGTVIAGIKAFNNTEVTVNPEVYVALYNNGALVSVQKVVIGEIGAYIEEPVEAAVSVTVPAFAEGDNYEIKVMTWEGLNPVAAAFELN